MTDIMHYYNFGWIMLFLFVPAYLLFKIVQYFEFIYSSDYNLDEESYDFEYF